MHTTFPITSTIDILNKLPMGEDEKISKLYTIKCRWVQTQYLGPSKVKDVEDSESEHEDDKWRQEQARKGLGLVAQRAAQMFEKYIINY